MFFFQGTIFGIVIATFFWVIEVGKAFSVRDYPFFLPGL